MNKAQKRAKKRAAANKRRQNELARQRALAGAKLIEAANLDERMNTLRHELIAECGIITAHVREWSENESENYLGDCIEQAFFAKQLFKEIFDRDVEVVAGYAAWQFGPEDKDNMDHDGRGRMSMGGFPGHAWVKIEDFYFDPSMWSVVEKSKMQDARDGLETNHTHDFGEYMLFRTKDRGSKSEYMSLDHYNETGEFKAGLYYYHESKDMLKLATRLYNKEADLEIDDPREAIKAFNDQFGSFMTMEF